MASRVARLGQAVLDLIIDDSRFHSKLSGAKIAAEKFTSDTGKNLGKAGKAITGVGESWSRNITAPIAVAGGVVTKFGLDFDTTMSEVVALTSVTQDQIGGIRSELIKLGPEVGKSPQELAEAFYFVASAGFEGSEALEVTKAAAKAAAAGLGDTATVAKVVGTAINAYGRENITAAEATDTLVAAIGEGSAEAPEFAGAIGNVIGSAAQIGASFNDVTAAIAAMTNRGIGAEEAVTSLNQIFVSLFKPTSQAAEALADMGLSAATLRQMIKEQGLLPTLQLLSDKFAGNAEATATVFGNVRALRGVLALTGGDVEATTGLFDRMQDTVGATGEAFASVSDSDAFKFRQSLAELQATAIEIGSDVLPIVVEVLHGVADAASDVADWWRTLDDETKDLIIRALGFVAVVGPVLVLLGKLTSGAGALFKAVTFLTGSKGIPLLITKLGGLRTALTTGGIVGLLIAVAMGLREITGQAAEEDKLNRFSSALEDAGITSDEVREAMESTGMSMHDFIDRFLELIDAGYSARDALHILNEGLHEFEFDRQKRELEEAGQAWEDYQNQISGAATEGVEDASDALAELPPEVRAQLEAAGIAVDETAPETFDGVDEEAAKARDAAIDRMKEMLKALANLFENDDTLHDAFQDLLDRMDDPYTEAERRADIFSQNTISVIRKALQSGDPAIAADTADLVNNMLTQIEAMEPGALASGEAVPPALQDGMDKQMSALIDWIEENVTGESLEAMTLEEAKNLGLEGIYLYAQGMARNRRLATYEAGLTGDQARQKLLEPDFYGAGQAGMDSYVAGWHSRLTAAQIQFYQDAAALRNILPSSEPKDPRSPWRGITKIGGSAAREIIDGWAATMPEWQRVLRQWGGIPGLTDMALPSMAEPYLPGASGLSAASRVSGAADSLPSTVKTVEYHLHYNGRERTFEHPADFLKELEAMDRFNDGMAGT